MNIRTFESQDIQEIRDICLSTADSGHDAHHLYNQPDLISDLYAIPYITHNPDACFCLEGDNNKLLGYCLGCINTELFNQFFIDTWFPSLKNKYQTLGITPEAKNMSCHDKIILNNIIHYSYPSHNILYQYPSHLHIDLLPAAQGQGNGVRLIMALIDYFKSKHSSGVHLGVSANNKKAIAFYQKNKFEILIEEKSDTENHTIIMGRRI